MGEVKCVVCSRHGLFALLVPACGFLLLELDFGFALDSISFFLARLLMTDD